MSKERLEEMKELLNEYCENIDDSFASADIAMEIVDRMFYFVKRVQELEEIEQEYVDLNNDFTNMALERKRYREVMIKLQDFVKRGEDECNIKQLIMKLTDEVLEESE